MNLVSKKIVLITALLGITGNSFVLAMKEANQQTNNPTTQQETNTTTTPVTNILSTNVIKQNTEQTIQPQNPTKNNSQETTPNQTVNLTQSNKPTNNVVPKAIAVKIKQTKKQPLNTKDKITRAAICGTLSAMIARLLLSEANKILSTKVTIAFGLGSVLGYFSNKIFKATRAGIYSCAYALTAGLTKGFAQNMRLEMEKFIQKNPGVKEIFGTKEQRNSVIKTAVENSLEPLYNTQVYLPWVGTATISKINQTPINKTSEKKIEENPENTKENESKNNNNNDNKTQSSGFFGGFFG